MKTKSEKIVYEGKIFEVVEETVGPDSGKQKVFESVRRAPGVRIIIPDDQGRICMTKELRREVGMDIRLPGGKVFDRLHEYQAFKKSGVEIESQIYKTAKKETQEEVGLDIDDLSIFYVSRYGATIGWDLYYVVAGSMKINPNGQALEDMEKIEPFWATHEEARQHALNDMADDRSAAVLLRWLEKQKYA